jgi:hypothetical protein
MSAARDLLADLDLIGARLEPAGDRLILRAGPMAVPSALVRRVREAKADLLATLAVSTDPTVLGSDGNREHIGNSLPDEGKHRTFESCVVKWLNRHPASSTPGRCAWCGNRETSSAVVLPFGTELGTHAWLHSECWPDWYTARRANAIAALRATSPMFDGAPVPDGIPRTSTTRPQEK